MTFLCQFMLLPVAVFLIQLGWEDMNHWQSSRSATKIAMHCFHKLASSLSVSDKASACCNESNSVRRRVTSKSGGGCRPVEPRLLVTRVQGFLRFLSWNVANISAGEFEGFIEAIGNECDWDLCALQELGEWSAGQHWFFQGCALIAGSLFIGSRPVGLLLKSEWYRHFVCSIDDPRHIAVRLRAGPVRDLLCASAHCLVHAVQGLSSKALWIPLAGFGMNVLLVLLASMQMPSLALESRQIAPGWWVFWTTRSGLSRRDCHSLADVS